ncbi:MAG: type II secretion system protein N, partial [Gammaproteobacteria bacterium]|nr:type II secretion system protein N [Gammaproteobacteria bacterium]
MRRWLGYGLLGLVAYGLFLLLLFPAHFAWSFAAEPLRQQLPQIEIAGVSGRLWQGEAVSVRYNSRQVGRLQWRLKPLSLLSGKLGLPISLL